MKMTNKEYHARPEVSSSGIIELIKKTPKHFKAKLENPSEPTSAMAFGTAAHMAILEHEEFKSTYAVKPQDMSFATKEGKAWKEANSSKEILTFDQYQAIAGMFAATAQNNMAMEFLTNAQIEESFFYEDMGVNCRCRPDIIAGNVIVDLKTSESASPIQFQRSINNYRYDVQAAWYLRGMKAATGQDYSFVFMVVEKEAPYDIAFYELDHESLFRANTDIDYALRTLKECQETGVYPGYDNGSGVQTISTQYFGM